MTPGDIIAFEATGETRHVQPGEFYMCTDGSCLLWDLDDDVLTVDSEIMRPIPSPEIAEAQRVLAAVARHRPTIEALAENRVTFTDDLLKMAKEILGS